VKDVDSTTKLKYLAFFKKTQFCELTDIFPLINSGIFSKTIIRCLNGVKCVQLPSEEEKSATVCGTAEVEEDPVLAFCIDDSAQEPGGLH
jgi:hypothetical protein